MQEQIFSKLKSTINALNINSISEDRRNVLQPLIDDIQKKVHQNETVRLNFICTHNSRRSHFSQVWAQIMATHFNVPKVFAYSGGTQATALFPFALETIKEHGVEITPLSEGKNPVYAIKFGENAHPVIGFSKTYDHSINPASGFAAIMTCAEAEKNCPLVAGAERRFAIPYEDPKLFDNTPLQAKKYRERSLQIATELLYVFSNISDK